jgi:hypothetical protein
MEVMPQYRIGDRVRCIDNDGAGRLLTLGAIYTVLEVTSLSLRFIDNEGMETGWKMRRFELAESASPRVYKYTLQDGSYAPE